MAGALRLSIVSVTTFVACAGADGASARLTTPPPADVALSSTTPPAADVPSAPPASGRHLDESTRTILDTTPSGTRTVTITTRTIDAPAPPARPADPLPADPLVRYNVARLNQLRAQARVPPLLYDAKISAFAREGSRELSRDHVPHAHFAAHVQRAPEFGSHSAENQGDPNGVPPQIGNGKAQIEAMLQMMMAEGAGGGHHDNIVSPRYRRVGIGILLVGGALYLTNDFSD